MIQQETMVLAVQEIHATHHATNCTVKNLATVVSFWCYAWLCSEGISDYSRLHFEDLLFDVKDLFNNKLMILYR